MENADQWKVSGEQLRRRCQVEKEIDFCETTRDVKPFETFIGQERAVTAMEFGLSMDVNGYNIFVTGAQGTGKTTYTQSAVKAAAKRKPIPKDWVYLYN
ncbi:MAG TPA: ATP-dependent protease, partial [Eubacteriaceae bacterium]|nr:ATP-dependent protease [Eubacteriaceae bacterium]